MASLESYAGAGVTATRTAATQTISITGGLLQVTGYLDAGTVPPGWRIDCSGGGGLAFNVPDATARDIALSARSGAALTLSAADWNALLTGDAVEKDGDLGDLDNGTVYYVEKGTSPTVHLHGTRAEALAGQSATRVSAGTGAVPGGDGGMALAAGRRDVGTIGDPDGAQVQILERADAFAFRGDNYNSATEISRFQAGKITLDNFYWESLRPNADPSDDAARSDFDIYPGAEPILRNGHIATLARYNHLSSRYLQLENVRFTNRTVAANDWVLEFGAALDTPPEGLALLPPGRAVAVLGVFMTDGVPLRLTDLSGVTQVELGKFNPGGNALTDAQADAKLLYLVNPAGSPAKRSERGQVEIRRAVTLDFGSEVAATEGTCRLLPTDESPPYAADVVDDAATGPHAFPEVLHKRGAGGASAYTTWANYRYLKVSPHYRKVTGTFTVAEQTSPGQVQTVTGTLTREVWPNGTDYAHSAVTQAASVDDIYRAVKAHELANPKDGGASVSLAVVNADGYLEMGADVNLVLSASATELTAWDSDTDTLTVKCAATVAASSVGVLGVQVTGTGTVTATGADTSAFLTKTASSQNSRVAVAAAEADVKLTLYASDGTQLGTHTAAAGSLSATFAATAAQSTTGVKLLASRAGYEPQVRTLDLSAGGSFSESFGPLRQLVQPDGSASYTAPSSPASTVTFNVSDLTDVSAKVEVANESLGTLAVFSLFASKTQSTANGQKYLAFGGQLPVPVALFTGDVLALPANVQIKRRASGNVNATVAASVFAPAGETILDETNGAVQLVGGVQLKDIQDAILEDADIDPDNVGVQSVAAKLLAAANLAQQNANAIAALPSAADVVTALLAASVATGGDTVKAALARLDDLPTDAAPSAADVVTALLAASVATGGDTVKAALARLDDLPTDAAPSSATVAAAVLSASVDGDGNTAKQGLAAAVTRPSAADMVTALMGEHLTDAHDMRKAMQVMFAVLAGTVARSGDTYTFTDSDGTAQISATADGDGERTNVTIG